MDASLGVSWSVVPEKNFNALIEQFKGKCDSWVRPLVLLIAIHDDLSILQCLQPRELINVSFIYAGICRST